MSLVDYSYTHNHFMHSQHEMLLSPHTAHTTMQASKKHKGPMISSSSGDSKLQRPVNFVNQRPHANFVKSGFTEHRKEHLP